MKKNKSTSKSLMPFENPLKLKKKILRKNKFGLKKVGKILLYLLGAFVLFTAVLFIWFAKDLPTPGKIKALKPAESTQIYDRNGNSLYSVFGEQRRTVLDKNDIPEIVKQATVAVEDKDFYKHWGVDFRGIIRSVFYNLTHQDTSFHGGSTITQQYVKNALLTSKQTITRKIQELILSLEIEMMYKKDDILTMYLNEIPYGSNVYGVEEASKFYFGKSAKDLTLAEAATIAAIPQAPTYYSPYGNHYDKLLERKDYALDRMVAEKYITQQQADEAKKQELSFKPFAEDIKAPHFVMYIKEQLVDMFGEQALENDGLKVTTTLDPKKQEVAENTINDNYDSVQAAGGNNAALVAIDPKTGQVLAMVGSHDYFDSDNDGQVNVATSERQPGSSFKPIVYATAFKGKYNPASILWDLKTDFGNYTPQNYDGTTHGPVTIRQALACSLNIPAVKMLYLAGMDNVIKTAKDMGITTLTEPDQYGLSLVLGGGEVKLLDMAGAYGTFANQGTFHETTGLLKVTDKDGKVLYEYKDNKNKKDALDPQVAYEITSILSDNNARSMVFGTNSPLYFPDRNVAVKTGTTDAYHDAWTIGYTPSLVTGIWVGNNDNSPMKVGSAAAMVAAPIFHEFMENALDGTPNEDFSKPDGIKEVTVEKFSNKLPGSNSKNLITDIFAAWQVPTEKDDSYITVKIDTSNNKLATDYCPLNVVQEKTYANIHSEVPENPDWENPVKTWLEANGFGYGKAPTEKCDIHTSDYAPTINITNPKSNDTLTGNFTITVDTKAHWGVSYIDYSIDNVSIGSSSASPYSFTYNANNLSGGNHQLTATVVDQSGMSTKSSITIKSSQTEPGNVTNVSLTPGTKTVTISWKNPSDSDLAKVKIYKSITNGSLGSWIGVDIPANPSENSTYTVTGLNSITTYYFTIRPVNNSGIENSSTTQYSATTN